MSPGYQLRPYQQDAVNATLNHFRRHSTSAVLVLPTGSGKSLVIAELGRLARRSILVITHVQELVEQNAEKFQALGLNPGIFSAGLKRRETDLPVTFGSVQSVAANLDQFTGHYSLLIIDECHRVSDQEESQYQKLINHLKQTNPALKVLGLTATPYRLDTGWIYRTHYRGFVRTPEPRVFEHCIFELPLSTLIKQGFLTEPKLIDAAVERYDFSAIATSHQGQYPERAINELLDQYPRVTEAIIREVIELAQTRTAVMIFAASVRHAEEIIRYLPAQEAALITGATATQERATLIERFKQQQLKYLVNVSVLTTGFDAPSVDLIAILRPTQSVSLYQQIVGRGLRLAPGKTDCLVIDYANNGIDLYYPEVGQPKPAADTEPVQVFCPECGHANIFWGRTDGSGAVLEHFGRRCQALLSQEPLQQCSYRFVFKSCPACNAENDIAARVCHQCQTELVDPDDLLKRALALNDRWVLRCQATTFEVIEERVKLTHHGEDGETLTEQFNLTSTRQQREFNETFIRRLNRPELKINSAERLLQEVANLPHPDFVIARKEGRFWRVMNRIFDYQGRRRKANQLN